MIKQLVFLKARDGLETRDLVDRYETGHAPLVTSLLPYFAGYHRNYVLPGAMLSRDPSRQAAPKPDFDVVTEIWYEDREKLEALATALEDEAVATAIRNSEATLFDQAGLFECDEFVTPEAMLQPRPAGHAGRPAIKLIGLIRKKAGMSRDAFIRRYEDGHCPLALNVLTKDGKPAFAGYRRSFPKADTMPAPRVEPLFDVMVEVWFWNEADFQHFQTHRADATVDAIITEDEVQLFDRASILMLAVEEHVSKIEI
jgi:hypothetical protein